MHFEGPNSELKAAIAALLGPAAFNMGQAPLGGFPGGSSGGTSLPDFDFPAIPSGGGGGLSLGGGASAATPQDHGLYKAYSTGTTNESFDAQGRRLINEPHFYTRAPLTGSAKLLANAQPSRLLEESYYKRPNPVGSTYAGPVVGPTASVNSTASQAQAPKPTPPRTQPSLISRVLGGTY